MEIINRAIFPVLKHALSDRRVIVLTGMRQVGKTTAVKWLLEQIPSSNKLYLDLERLDYRSLFNEPNYELALIFLRNLGLDLSQPAYVALDEIQYAPNVPSVVKYLFDSYRIKFILTGSSSYYLKNLFTESLAGRKVIYEMFPLRFGEFLDFKGTPWRPRRQWDEMLFDRYEFERLKGRYEEYLRFGGLPAVALASSPRTKTEMLNDILSSYINIDVKALADFQKMAELQQLMRILASRIGNRLNNTKLAAVVGISRPTLLQYLEFLEKTYVIHRLPAYTNNPDKKTALARKLYFYDNGIANILGRISEGAMFENAVFNQLRPYGKLAYFSKRGAYEIDFILNRDADEPVVALEAKLSPIENDLRKLQRISSRHGWTQSYIVGRYPTPGFSRFIWGGLIF